MKHSREDVRRFLEFVYPTESGCWIWLGARSRGKGNTQWYGSFHVNKKTVRAHRFALEMVGRECPRGMHRDHVCHNSLCVNPAHLIVTTRAENQNRKNENRARGKKASWVSVQLDALCPRSAFEAAAEANRLVGLRE